MVMMVMIVTGIRAVADGDDDGDADDADVDGDADGHDAIQPIEQR